MFELYSVSNYFNFFIHFFVRNDVMFYTVVYEFELLCGQEILYVDRWISLDSQEVQSNRKNSDTRLIMVLRQ